MELGEDVKQDKCSRDRHAVLFPMPWTKEIRRALITPRRLPHWVLSEVMFEQVRLGMSSFSKQTLTLTLEPPPVGLRPGQCAQWVGRHCAPKDLGLDPQKAACRRQPRDGSLSRPCLSVCLNKSMKNKNKTQLMLFSLWAPADHFSTPTPSFLMDLMRHSGCPIGEVRKHAGIQTLSTMSRDPVSGSQLALHFARFLKSGPWFPGCFSCPLITSAYLISKSRNCFKKKKKS